MQYSGIPPVEARLSCKQCQQRKIKCDRRLPCFRCRQSGLKCEEGASRAAPSGHYVDRNTELRKRLKRLESMVFNMQSQKQALGQDHAGPPNPPRVESPNASLSHTIVPDTVPAANRYIAGDFWDSLAGEVQGLRDVLDENREEQEAGLVQFTPDGPTTPSRNAMPDPSVFDFVLVDPGRIHMLPGALPELSKQMQFDMFDVYSNRVDVAWKIFHAPSLSMLVLHDQQYLGYAPLAPCNRALRAAIYYAGVSHISINECVERYGQPHERLLEDTRRVAEAALVQADLLSTKALPVIQALTVYIATFRRHDAGHRSWSLFGLALRLAQVIGLDRETADENAFLQQVRRRLWHHLCVLDSFFAFDRGSDPLITAGSFQRPLPSNVNDDALSEATTVATPLSAEGKVTDMNFALMLQELYHVAHRLDVPAVPPGVSTWQHRLDATRRRNESIAARYMKQCNPEIAFQRLTIRIGEIVQASNLLSVVRPINRASVTDKLPPVGASWVLNLAVDVLRKCERLFEDEELAKWNRLPWVQWHPLAVVLSGLCCHQGTPLADEAWLFVDRTMGRDSAQVADTAKGKLWQPLSRLYRRALAFRTFHQGQQFEEPLLYSAYGADTLPLVSAADETLSAGGKSSSMSSNFGQEPGWNTPNWATSSDVWQYWNPQTMDVGMPGDFASYSAT